MMSHTVVYDQSENTKAIMNAVNSFARHCKIGKVTMKTAGQRLIASAQQAKTASAWSRLLHSALSDKLPCEPLDVDLLRKWWPT